MALPAESPASQGPAGGSSRLATNTRCCTWGAEVLPQRATVPWEIMRVANREPCHMAECIATASVSDLGSLICPEHVRRAIEHGVDEPL